jgi:hypothetical protein
MRVRSLKFTDPPAAPSARAVRANDAEERLQNHDRNASIARGRSQPSETLRARTMRAAARNASSPRRAMPARILGFYTLISA